MVPLDCQSGMLQILRRRSRLQELVVMKLYYRVKLLSLPHSTSGTWLKFPDCKEQLTVTVVCYCTESPTVREPCLVPVLNLPLSFFLSFFITLSQFRY